MNTEVHLHEVYGVGTTTLFAALEVATGKVTDRCYDRHTNIEFLAFLRIVARAYPRAKLHVVCDVLNVVAAVLCRVGQQ